ncbi:WASH complex subunit 7 [Hypsibius exemplaris]|uniref:WASH complex subunit 7 n=1 Tax=Hypsibius exemplaris TaxID=2072580 RepID=A0A1W0WBP0_HYPEX|nr:WASH complex subunit 7 [Hypsibius exemplaris]
MMNPDVSLSLQKRVLKKGVDLIGHLQRTFEQLDVSSQAWMLSLSAYGDGGALPLQAEINPYERAAIDEFVRTENDLFGKVIVALSVMACEVRFLTNEARLRFLDPLLHYSDEFVDCSPNLSIGRFLSFLQELSNFKTRCKEVILLFIRQLDALGERESGIGAVPFLLGCLSELFVCLIAADGIVRANNTLREHWNGYRASISACVHSPVASTKLNISNGEVKEVDGFLVGIEKAVLSGTIFTDCIQDVGKTVVGKKVLEHIAAAISATGTEIEATQDPTRIGYRVVGAGAFLILHTTLSRTAVDKKLLRIFLDLCRLNPVTPLWRNVSISPADSILQLIPDSMKHVDRKQLQTIPPAKEGILQARIAGMPKDVAAFKTDAMDWVERMQTLATESEPVISDECAAFLRNGLLLARKVQNYVMQTFHYHSVLLKPISRTVLQHLGVMLEILVVLKGCVDRYGLAVCQLSERVKDFFASRIHMACYNLEKRLALEKRGNFGAVDQVDSLTALKVLQQAVATGPLTEERLVVLRVCFGICLATKRWPSEEIAFVLSAIPVIKDLCSFQKSFRIACDVSIFYWNRMVLRPYLEEVYQNPIQAARLTVLLAAFETSAAGLHAARHETSSVLLKNYRTVIMGEVKEYILDPLCKDIETNLRLLVHSHLSLPDRNPFESAVRDLRMFTSLGPIYFLGQCVSVRDYVEKYLDRTFYDLTTVALHDWKTYDEMRSLAFHLYGLNVIQAHLPNQTVEQGADILEIMRNINSFVTSYTYNLNNQVFVERSSNNKHLNTIGIRHVANSLRTHGIGVMNTTVNYTYQFLRKNFNIFSQFMFDEQIKSRLIKDIKLFRELKQTDAMARYPFEKAEKFNKGIRTLGVTPDGLTKLDQFRLLITHIGNAMGFVRTVRSGGLHQCSKAICFIPDLEDLESFEELGKTEAIATEFSAAKDLDEVVTLLTKNLSDGTEFFKLLVEVFSGEFRHAKNRHLQNFYVIVPPLMVNFVDHAVTCKERIHKKNPSGLVLFTDDGFAMGVAYILALLNQNSQFDSLNWNDSVREKFRKDAEAAALVNRPPTGTRTEAENDEKLKQALKLTARRVDAYVKEFDLLFYSFSSARIFFKSTVAPPPAAVTTDAAAATGETPAMPPAAPPPAS